MTDVNAIVLKLESLLPTLKEKVSLGLVFPNSHEKAVDLIRWHKAGRPYSEKQLKLVNTLLFRAQRGTTKGKIDAIKAKIGSGGGSVDTDELLNQLMAQVREEFDGYQVDVDKVIAGVLPRVIEAMEARSPRRIEIEVKHVDGSVKVIKADTHCQFQHLMRAATRRLEDGYVPGIFLKGERSSGKTTGCKQLAEALKLKWHFNGAISFPHEMLGFIDGNGKYHRTPFREAYEHGGVYTFDEVDRSEPVALLAVNPHLSNGVATFPDKQIKRHKDCIITATGNTWGLGADAEYSGATKLDGAFLSRFPIKINWDIDTELEKKIVPNAEWLARIHKARMNARTCGLKVTIDTRAAQAGLALIGAGYTPDEAALMTYLADLRPEQRRQVEV